MVSAEYLARWPNIECLECLQLARDAAADCPAKSSVRAAMEDNRKAKTLEQLLPAYRDLAMLFNSPLTQASIYAAVRRVSVLAHVSKFCLPGGSPGELMALLLLKKSCLDEAGLPLPVCTNDLPA